MQNDIKTQKEKGMNKKTVVKIIIVVALLSALAILAYFQIKPLEVNSIEVEYMEMEDWLTYEDLKKSYEDKDNLANDVQIIRGGNVYPSEKNEDYCQCVVYMSAKNRGIFDIKNIQAYVNGEGEDSIIILKEGELESHGIEGISENNQVVLLSLFIYKDNMSEQEICDYIKDLEVTISFETLLNSDYSRTIKLSDYIK